MPGAVDTPPIPPTTRAWIFGGGDQAIVLIVRTGPGIAYIDNGTPGDRPGHRSAIADDD
jgi:hypothetical protein